MFSADSQGDHKRRIQRCQAVQIRDPILAALRGSVADIHAALVVHNVASDDQTDRWNVERSRIGTIVAIARVPGKCSSRIPRP